MRQHLVSRIPLIIPVFIIALLIPWNNSDVKKSSQKDDIIQSNHGYTDLRNFPVLRISKNDLIALFTKQAGQPKVHKLVFKFNINDAQALNPSLTVFRAQQNDRKYLPNLPAVSPTLARVNQTCEITGEYTLGNLELHKNDWANILALANAADTYLYFYPKKEQHNGVGLYNIVYKLYWGNDAPPYECDAWMKLAPPPPPDGGLNPSPPADPS